MQQLPHPITVIQLLKKKLVYGKALKAFDKRTAAIPIPVALESDNGVVKGGRLYLTKEIAASKQLSQSSCILLLDEVLVNAEGVAEGIAPALKVQSSFMLLPNAKHLTKWDVFGFRFENEVLETFFEWDYFKVGQPARAGHKLFDLPTGKTVRFSVNGKVDSSLTAGTRRYYQEMDYTFQHCGQHTEYEYQSGVSSKQLDAAADKTVSLMKTLY
jgi:hypothetical protein